MSVLGDNIGKHEFLLFFFDRIYPVVFFNIHNFFFNHNTTSISSQ